MPRLRQRRILLSPDPNVLDRQFTTTAPNQKWVAEFTYLDDRRVALLAVVLDLFSRRVVGWSMHPAMTARLVTDALTRRAGGAGRWTPSSITQTGGASTRAPAAAACARATCSMSHSGNVWDNAVMESFFSTLKTERTNRKHYATRNAARAEVFDCIERFLQSYPEALDPRQHQPDRGRAGGSSLTHCPPNPAQLGLLERSSAPTFDSQNEIIATQNVSSVSTGLF